MRSNAVYVALASLTLASTAFAGDYTVDSAHSRVGFSITHLTVSTVHGSFGAASGTVSYDPKNVAATKINAKVTVGSINTVDEKRDGHLKSPDFFDAAKFPEMTFVSKAVKNITPQTFDVVGDLTIHGVTKETTLHVNTLSPEVKDPWGNVKIGTHAEGSLNRKDFGLVWNQTLETGGLLVGEDVKIELDIEMTKAK
jgi:polyisoprenoid-binding protein YceI